MDLEALKTAARKGDLRTVQQIVHAENCAQSTLDGALQGAAEGGHNDIVLLLLARGADIRADDERAIRAASSEGHINTVKLLKDSGADIRRAFHCGDLATLKQFLEWGADVNAEAGEALKNAAFEGNLTLVEFLDEQGADLEIDNGAPLIWAAEWGEIEIVKHLLARDALRNIGEALEAARAARSNKGMQNAAAIIKLFEAYIPAGQLKTTAFVVPPARGEELRRMLSMACKGALPNLSVLEERASDSSHSAYLAWKKQKIEFAMAAFASAPDVLKTYNLTIPVCPLAWHDLEAILDAATLLADGHAREVRTRMDGKLTTQARMIELLKPAAFSQTVPGAFEHAAEDTPYTIVFCQRGQGEPAAVVAILHRAIAFP